MLAIEPSDHALSVREYNAELYVLIQYHLHCDCSKTWTYNV